MIVRFRTSKRVHLVIGAHNRRRLTFPDRDFERST